MQHNTRFGLAVFCSLSAGCATITTSRTSDAFHFPEAGPTPPLRAGVAGSETEAMPITGTRLPRSHEYSPVVLDERTVAFVTDDAGQLDICYVDYANTAESSVGGLATTSDDEKAPFVAGQRCYFVTNADGRFQIMSGALPKVRSQRVEAQSVGHANWPHVSKDGRRMLYSVLNAHGVYEIWMRDYASGSEHRLIEGQRARWNPSNAEEFVFTRQHSDSWEICKYSLNDSLSVLNRTGADNFDPEYSPDGRHIAFTSNKNSSSDIWLMRADGANARCLDTHGAIDCQPVWTPDGRSLIFASNRSGGFDLWRISNLELEQTAAPELRAEKASP